MPRSTTMRRSSAPPRQPAARRQAPMRRMPGQGPGGLALATFAAPAPGMMSLPGTAPAPPMARMAPPASKPATEAARMPATAEAAAPAEAAEAETALAEDQAAESGASVEAGAASEAPEIAEPAAAEGGEAAELETDGAAEVTSGAGPEAAEEPEVEAGPSPEEAVAPAAAAVGRRASAASAHQPAEAAGASAIQASNVPAVSQAREAERAGITAADDTPTGKIEVAAFKAQIQDALDQAVPPPRNEREAERQVERGPVDAAAPLQSALAEQTAAAAGDLPATAAAEPDPSQVAPPPEVELQPEEVGEAPAPVSAAAVVPPPTPAAALDSSQNEARVDQLAAESNITEEQLQRGNDPQFEAALGARSEAEAHDEAAPAAYREEEAAAREETRGRAAGRIGASLADIHATRAEQIGAVAQTQTETQTVTAARKAEITETIAGIGRTTRTEVTDILTKMQESAAKMFNDCIARAQTRFDAIMEDAVGGGWFSSLFGNWFDNSDEYEAALEDATAVYDAIVAAGIDDVATFVVQELQRAKDRVARGREEIDRYVNETLTEDERQFGEDASTAITADFDALEGEIEESRGAVVNSMVEIYRAGLEAREASAAEFKERSKSIWQRVYDATVGVIQKVIEFKNMLLGILARAAAVVEAIIQDPIGFLSNLIAGIGAGLQRFVDNIGENLKQALMGWLFGALEGAGLKLPAKFDLMGFFDIVLQVLGLTKENVRARAVKLLGEETVARIEKAVDFLRMLFTEGPAAVWEMLLEQLGNLKDAIIEEIKSWVITKIVIAGVKWIVSLLNPASAFVKACMMIYDIVMFFMERGQQIISAVTAIVNALGTIVAGNIGAMAAAVEGALNRILPVVIGFLASLLGLGGISDQIRKFIEAVQAPVNKAIDWIINKAVAIAKKIGGLFGGKDDKAEEDPEDPEKEMKIAAAEQDLDRAETREADEGGVTRDEAEALAQKVRQDHPVIKSIRVVPGSGTWNYVYTSSPEETHTGSQPAQGTEPPPGVIALDENTWKIEKPIEVSFNVRAKFVEAGLTEEYRQQLGEQEAGINAQTVKTWTDRRTAYEERSRIAKERRASGEAPRATARTAESATAQAAARANYLRDRVITVARELASDPANASLSNKDLRDRANDLVAAEMSQLHALHAPDQIAGGDPGASEESIARLGSARVNVSIGAQWRHAPREETRRVSETDEPRERIRILDTGVAALHLDDDAKAKTLMHVRLQARFIE